MNKKELRAVLAASPEWGRNDYQWGVVFICHHCKGYHPDTPHTHPHLKDRPIGHLANCSRQIALYGKNWKENTE